MVAIKTEDTIDLLIIGGGPAGGTAADRALDLGARVALIEPDHIGGT
jgi:dihydrolipoamide dehydrogenase